MSAEVIAYQRSTKRVQRGRAPILWPWLLVATAWLLALSATLTNHQYLIDHHWLMGESGLPWPIATLLFLASWQVMTLAMMLPASMSAAYMVTLAGRRQRHPHLMPVSFLAGYLVVWTVFALVTFGADTGEQWLAHSWPWLDTRPWFIGAMSLAVAGIFQFSPFKGRYLTACRRPLGFFMRSCREGEGGAWRLGMHHSGCCLGSTWALMLVMFGVSIGSLAGMAVLAGVMVVENVVVDEQRLRLAVGAACLALAVVWLAHPTGLLRIVAGASPAAPATAVQVGQTYYSGGYAIMLQATPEKSGANTFVVTLKNGQRMPVNAAQVVVETTILDMDMGTQQVVLQPDTRGALGVYDGRGELSMPGHWEIVVRVRPTRQTQAIQAVFVLSVT